MGEPITVGGGGGFVENRRTLADYDIELRFDDTKFQRNADGDYVYAGYKIDKLLIQDFNGTTILDCTPLLPDDRVLTIILRFKHFPERINIKNKPITISFDEDLWETAGAGSKLWTRQTRHDGTEVDLGRSKWKKFEVATPLGGFQIRIVAEPI
jgi:hypothetical protein